MTDEEGMVDTFESATKWLRRLSESAFRVPAAAKELDSAWFAGMAIGPVEFSEQLGNLQVSLQRIGIPDRSGQDTRVS